MKFLFDLLPVLLFFVAYASGRTLPTIGLNKSIEVATLTAMCVSIVQIAYMLLRRRKIDTLQWITFGLIVTMGSATLLLHNPVFIYIKPTAISGVMALAMLISRYGLNKSPLKLLLGKEIHLSDVVWDKMMWSWVAFFVIQGVANLYVAFCFSEAVWVKYHFYSWIGFAVVFITGQAIWLSRHLPDDKAPPKES